MKRRWLIQGLLALILAIIPLVFISQPALAVADRYWIGGSGNWSDTAHWSTSDGGGGGASVPGVGNDARFTNNSSATDFTVTINAAASCLTWDSSTVDDIMTIAGSSTLNVAGSMIWKNNHIRSWTGALTFSSTAGGNTIDLQGIGLASAVNFNGAGGSWQLTSAFSTTGTFTLTNGNLDTNGQAVSSGSVAGATGTNTLTLGASTWTITGSWTATLLDSITCNTSTLTFTGAATQFTGRSLTYYDVNFNGTGTVAILDASNIFHNFTRNGPGSTDYVYLYGGMTVNGLLTLNGFSDTNRLTFRSNTTTLRTVTAASVTGDCVSFYYIQGAGAAAPWNFAAVSGGAANVGGNVNLLLTSTIYLGTGNKWTYYSGGPGHDDFTPPITGTAMDIAMNWILDANTPAGSSFQFSTASYRYVTDITCTGAPGAQTIYGSGTSIYVYGNVTLCPGFQWGSGGTSYPNLIFNKTGVQTYNMAGGSWLDGGGMTYINTQSTVNLTGDMDSEQLKVYGVLNTNNYDVYLSASFLTYAGSTLNLGSSYIVSNYADLASTTINAGTSWIYINGGGTVGTFKGYGKTYYDLTIYNQGSTSLLEGTNTFHDLTFLGAAAYSYANIAADQLVTNNFIVTGYNPTAYRIFLRSSVGVTQRTIYVNGGYAITYADVQDIVAAGTTKPWDISDGLNQDFGNNLFITFTPTMDIYWVGNTGAWAEANHWATTSGGAGGSARVPLVNDNAIFDANSVTLPLQTITINLSNISTITASAVANSPTFTATTIYIYGSLTLGPCTWSITNTYFNGRTEVTLSTINTFTTNLYINKDQATMAAVTLQSNITASSTAVTLLQGTLKLGIFTLTAPTFVSSDVTYNRALDMDTGTMVLNSTAATTKFNVSGTKLTVADSPTSTIILTNSGANAQTLAGGSKTYGNLTIKGAGNYILSVTGTNSFSTLTIDRSEANKTLSGTVTMTITGFVMDLSGTRTITISNTDFTMTSGEVYGDYLILSGSNAAGGATFWANAGGHSTDSGGNAGWLWTQPTPPTIVTLDPSEVSYIGERFNGQLSAKGQYSIFYCYFEYGPSTGYGFLTGETTLYDVGTFSNYLAPYKVYHYRAAVRFGLGWILYGADKIVSLTGAVGQAVAEVQDPGLDAGTSLVTAAPAEPGQMYDEGNTAGIPLAPLVDPALTASNTPEAAFWYPIAFAIAIVLGFIGYALTRSILVQSIVSAIVMAAFCGGGALGDGLIPYWTVLIFCIEALCVFLIQEKQNV